MDGTINIYDLLNRAVGMGGTAVMVVWLTGLFRGLYVMKQHHLDVVAGLERNCAELREDRDYWRNAYWRNDARLERQGNVIERVTEHVAVATTKKVD